MQHLLLGDDFQFDVSFNKTSQQRSHGDMFLYSNQRPQNMIHNTSPSTPIPLYNHSSKHFPKQDSPGWSLNERFLGYKTPSKEGLVSFELLEGDDRALQRDDYKVSFVVTCVVRLSL